MGTGAVRMGPSADVEDVRRHGSGQASARI